MSYIFIANFALFLSFLFRLSRYRTVKFSQVPHINWLIVLFFLVILSSFFAVNPVAHWLYLERILKVWVFVFLFYKVVENQKFLDWAIACYCGGTFYVSFRAWEMGRVFGERLEVIKLADGTDANGVAVAILISVPILIYYLFFGKNRLFRFAALGALAFNFNALVLLNSRGAFLGLIGSCAYLFFRTIKEGKGGRNFIRGLALVAVVLAILVYMADTTFWQRMATLKNEQDTASESKISRVTFWWKSFEMLADHPLGTGAAGYEALSSQYMPAEWLTKGSRAVHSTWFEVLTSFGFQGLMAFVMYLFFCFRELNKVRSQLKQHEGANKFYYYQSIALESSLVAYLIPATFVGTFFVESSYWIPMFISVYYRINYLDFTRNIITRQQLPTS